MGAYIKIVLETRQVSHRDSSTIATKQNFPIVLEFRYFVPLACKVLLKREAK